MYTSDEYADLERRAADAERALLRLYLSVTERGTNRFESIVNPLDRDTVDSILKTAARYEVPLWVDGDGYLIRP